MQYEVFVRRTDLLKMNILMLPRLLQTYLGFGFLVACAALGGVQSLNKHGPFIWLSTSFVVGVSIFLIIVSITIVLQAITATEKKGTIGKTVYKLNESFFIEETIGTETKTRWESIAGIYKFKKYIFVRINSMRIHIIPRREFVSTEEFEIFYREILNYRKSA